MCGVSDTHPSPESKEGSWGSFPILRVVPYHLGPTVVCFDAAGDGTAPQESILPAYSWSEVPSQACSGTFPQSRSRSRSPWRRRYSRSPRRGRRHQDTSGVAELTSKMSQFMEVMMGQQSLLMTLANVVPWASELPTRPITGQPVVLPPVPHDQPQEVWDVDAVSRGASDAEPLFEEGTEPEVTSPHSEQDDQEVLDTNDPMWLAVERAARHLGVDWPASEPTRCSLFELPSAQPSPFSLGYCQHSLTLLRRCSPLGEPRPPPLQLLARLRPSTMHGASEAGLASFPPVGAAFAALVKAPTLSGLAKDPSCPNRQCRITEAHLKKGYAAATEVVRLSNVASLLTVYQATLLRDLPECPSAALRTELGTIAQLLVKLAQLNARAQGRSIASLVVARRQLWLSQARLQEPDKAPLLDAPISPGHTFDPAVEEMLQRSIKAREASQQLAKMWPSKPFQPRRPQERQWRRAPPQQQAQPRGSKTVPSGVSARGQPAFARPQRGGWRPRGGGKPRPRGSGQAPPLNVEIQALLRKRAGDHRSASGAGHRRSSRRNHGAVRLSLRVYQRAANLRLQDRSAEGGALEEVVDHVLVALARHLLYWIYRCIIYKGFRSLANNNKLMHKRENPLHGRET
ncbi:UNVERIFIED_CONTAM: hypothetical protein FKN15_074821 [Acipenser sinensis]